MRKNITLLIDSVIYNKYRQICKDKGLITSRQVEIMMEKTIDLRKRKGDRK